MELSVYQLIMIGAMLVIQTAGAVAWISKVKNDLNTRVAVLEAGHTAMTEDLREIKEDVKALLRAVAA